MAKCTAKAKSTGNQCTRDAMNGTTVCYVHGGPGALKSQGMGAKQTKHGRYSKHLPTRIQANYEDAKRDTELLSLRNEAALMDARIADLLDRVESGESGALWQSVKGAFDDLKQANGDGNKEAATIAARRLDQYINRGVADYAAWNEVAKAVENKRRLSESENKRLVQAQQTITVERVMLLITAIASSVNKHVADNDARLAIGGDIGRLITIETEAANG